MIAYTCKTNPYSELKKNFFKPLTLLIFRTNFSYFYAVLYKIIPRFKTAKFFPFIFKPSSLVQI